MSTSLLNIAGADGRGQTPHRTEPIFVKAGQHKMAAAFVRKIDGPYEDLIKPHEWSYAGGGSGGSGITTLPHMADLVVRGPIKADGHLEYARAARRFSRAARPRRPTKRRARGRSSRASAPRRIAVR